MTKLEWLVEDRVLIVNCQVCSFAGKVSMDMVGCGLHRHIGMCVMGPGVGGTCVIFTHTQTYKCTAHMPLEFCYMHHNT